MLEPGPLDVRVRVSACALNPVDAKIVNWKGMISEMQSNFVVGLDVSGVIDAGDAKFNSCLRLSMYGC